MNNAIRGPIDMASPTVLIVDDEETGLYVRKLVLESQGFRVVTAQNGAEALNLFSQQRIDAVITDQVMPGMDGVEVATKIKQVRPELPIIMLSALPVRPEGAEKVVDSFVVKGQAPGVLIDNLSSLLQRRSHSHEDFDGDYVAFVNHDRRYLDVTDGVCTLLGYSRSDLLNMRIDDVAAPIEAENVAPLFERYVAEKGMDGVFVLKDSRGKLIPIRYHSRVLPDGCMVARWEPQV
jgi:PAS domain S-box-containing protein